jgi:hypothetical protein
MNLLEVSYCRRLLEKMNELVKLITMRVAHLGSQPLAASIFLSPYLPHNLALVMWYFSFSKLAFC